jgi:hypothetical protein
MATAKELAQVAGVANVGQAEQCRGDTKSDPIASQSGNQAEQETAKDDLLEHCARQGGEEGQGQWLPVPPSLRQINSGQPQNSHQRRKQGDAKRQPKANPARNVDRA